MSEPACKTCRHFQPCALDENSGECMDRTKRIYPRRTAACEVSPPWIVVAEAFTCANHEAEKKPA